MASSSSVDLVIARPFEPALLLRFLRQIRIDARVEAKPLDRTHGIYRFADLELDTATVRVSRNGRNIALTALPFRLLRSLIENPTVILNREQLIGAGWPDDADVEPRTVDIHIGHIRRALAKYGPDIIRTVPTQGYALDL